MRISSVPEQWMKDSWKEKEALHQPSYVDATKYEEVLYRLEMYPPLVFLGEVETLKNDLAQAAKGEQFILQGGDCAERFIDCNPESIVNKLKILLQMSVIITHAIRKPVIRIGRMAGQFFKPRSSAKETVDGNTMFTYKGDSINRYQSEVRLREPDPERLLTSFYHSAVTLNYLRSLVDGGFADLHHPYSWNLHSIEETEKWAEYSEIVEHVLDAIHFMETFGGINPEKLARVQFYISHEALHLGYEQSLTRQDKETGSFYNGGAHMLWIGERTRGVDGAHVEYCRGITNPIGIKLGPTSMPDELVRLLDRLNPKDEPGKIVLISRMGADHVEEKLPSLIQAVRESGKQAVWSCDPMHGNTMVTDTKLKTRRFSDVLEELVRSFAVHKREGSILAGVHFELTAEDVTECTGGAIDLRDKDLSTNYQSYCDPRLNYAQSIEMAFLLAKQLRSR